MQKHMYVLPFVILFLIFNFQQALAQKSGIETAGDIGLVSAPVAALTVALLQKDKQGTWQFTKGFLFNQAVTFGLKAGVNKPRPHDNGDNAFPSGHTSTTFQAASFIHKRYGFKYSIPSYALAGFTAFSRIDAQKHDGWDILAGAVIGIGSTMLFTTEYQQEHMELTFNTNEGDYLVGFKYTF
ncbi:phosphatase PAP2 family protein [Gelidibacter salicanalis]|uniref:Phosphatase PAP2 family protein n=1 Tax=Gelidibacter salicanalis TaxID=291193 RepID=A0A934NDH5_9FLAO|nr:phosphatase PAP2 family protein [Gelidibacter salicanalis]MBJ7881715.1 phosphatase PAP2 family protein [Gelidibacter salicanalis]